MPNFNGTESAEDVLNVALSEFSARPDSQRHRSVVIYQNDIPYLRYESAKSINGPEYMCLYRLDTMLLPFFKEAERAFDAVATPAGVEKELREPLVRYLACFGMQVMLGRLLMLQRELFMENFEEGKLVTSTFLLQSIVAATRPSKNTSGLVRNASRNVKKWLDEVVEKSMKKKRDFLIAFANKQPLLTIPTKPGRPVGATKPKEQKEKEAEKFAKEIEAVIRSLYSASGQMPTKTAVAKALGIGGVNPNTGVDSSLMVFRAKLARLDMDYNPIADKVRLTK